MIKIKRDPDTFSRTTKSYDLEVNEKEVELNKTLSYSSVMNEYEADYEILSVKNKDDEDVELTDEELEELEEFIPELSPK